MKKLTQAQKINFIFDHIVSLNKMVKPATGLPFEIYPKDIGVMTYVDAVKSVAKLGDGWRIPTLEELRLMYKNKDSTYCTTPSGSDFPDWYWSSTEDRLTPSNVHLVRFSDGDEDWNRKDDCRLSCRPVRLVAAPGL